MSINIKSIIHNSWVYKSHQKWKQSRSWLSMSFITNFPSRRVRLFLLRRKGAVIAKKVSIWRGVEIRNPKGLVIGEGSAIGPGVTLDARKGLRIGKNVTIAKDSIIWTLHHDMNSVDFHTIGAETVVDDYAWVCSRSILLPGVHVGRGAVIASGAVLSKNADDYSIMGGVPAKKIGERKETDFSYVPFMDLHVV